MTIELRSPPDQGEEALIRAAIKIEERRGPALLANVPLSRLRLVASYQRTLEQHLVRRMVARWNPAAFGVIYVSERTPGTYIVIDGQHRVVAYRAVAVGDDPPVPCLVHAGLSEKEEAVLFTLYNADRKPPTAADLFSADLVAEKDDALGIVEVVGETGLHIGHGGNAEGHIQAIQAVRRIWRMGGRERLRDVLSILHAAYGKERYAYQAGMLRGMDLFLEKYEDEPLYRRESVVEALRRNDPSVILRRVQLLSSGPSRDTTGMYGQAIWELYNKTARRKRLPDWGDPAIVAKGHRRGVTSNEQGDRIKRGLETAALVREVWEE